ncbi:MAG: hypothetical protein Q9173_005402 [Seirophora scorigena]
MRHTEELATNRDLNGFDGPVKVSFGHYTYPVAQDFLRATEPQGIPTTDDLQDLVTGHGAEHWLKWINRDTGRQSDSAHAYIHPTIRTHENLYLMCNTKIDKVIIEDGEAVAVQCVPRKPPHPQQQQQQRHRNWRQGPADKVGAQGRPHERLCTRFFGDYMLLPPGIFFSMFYFLEYLFLHGSTYITSANPYDAPDFDAGSINDERDMGLMVWAYIKFRKTARRMDAFFAYDSPAAAQDLNLQDTKAYGGPNHLSAGIQHGSWSIQTKPGRAPSASFVSSSQPSTIRDDLKYTPEDIAAVEEWVKRHIETTWHSLGTCSMAPKAGNLIVKHGVLDERLNVHRVQGLKCAGLSICPDNVGCNTYSTALLIGEKAAMLVAEDLGYSEEALKMKVPV